MANKKTKKQNIPSQDELERQRAQELARLDAKDPYKPMYKYMCPACTNEAFRSAEQKVGLIFTCPTCGVEQAVVIQNYIKL